MNFTAWLLLAAGASAALPAPVPPPAAHPECFYCARDARLTDRMIEVCRLRRSTLYLLRNQHYPGRCVVAFDEHKTELYQLTAQERADFMNDVSDAAAAIAAEFHPAKMNYAIFGDEVSHLHVHLAPKSPGVEGWGQAFPDAEDRAPRLLTPPEYERIAAALRARLGKAANAQKK